jgi:NAD(P)-dependent dehydrogenase (short-subunit alcohol dehydrogenase family)
MEELYGLNHVGCVKVDLADPHDIARFAARMEDRKLELNIFVQSAGVYNDVPSSTEEGFDRAYAVNHLGHAMMTEALLPSIARAASKDELARIISVNCGVHRFASFLPEQVNTSWIQYRRGLQAYAFSKWAQLAHAKFLADRFKKYGIAATVNSVNPGAFIDTRLARRSFFHRSITRFANKFGIVKTPEQAAAEIVYLATEPSLKRVSGKYFENYTVRCSSPVVSHPLPKLGDERDERAILEQIPTALRTLFLHTTHRI